MKTIKWLRVVATDLTAPPRPLGMVDQFAALKEGWQHAAVRSSLMAHSWKDLNAVDVAQLQ
jgi:hypothetical protein